MSSEPKTQLGRREILRVAATGSAAAALSSCRPKRHHSSGKPGRALTADELALCGAACARILPSDSDPGAVELGVVDYIDRRLARSSRRALQARRRFRQGLAQFSEWSLKKHGHDFVDLPAGAQDVALASFAAEGGDQGYAFVRQLMIFTMEGAFSDPSYGGNRDRGGWKLVGFDAPCPNPRCK